MSHVYGSGYYGAGRSCVTCGHGEYRHFGPCMEGECGCATFAARELTAEERAVEPGKGTIYSAEALDQFSELKRHLERVMDEASEK